MNHFNILNFIVSWKMQTSLGLIWLVLRIVKVFAYVLIPYKELSIQTIIRRKFLYLSSLMRKILWEILLTLDYQHLIISQTTPNLCFYPLHPLIFFMLPPSRYLYRTACRTCMNVGCVFCSLYSRLSELVRLVDETMVTMLQVCVQPLPQPLQHMISRVCTSYWDLYSLNRSTSTLTEHTCILALKTPKNLFFSTNFVQQPFLGSIRENFVSGKHWVNLNCNLLSHILMNKIHVIQMFIVEYFSLILF